MLSSMTGYGIASDINQDYNFSVEIKSVNNKYLDIQIKSPNYLGVLEEDIKNIIKTKLSRGRVDIFIKEQKKTSLAVDVSANLELARNVYNELKSIRNELNLGSDIAISDILKTPEILTYQVKEIEIDELKNFLFEILNTSLGNLYQMRLREGIELKKVLLGNIRLLKNNVDKIYERAPYVVEEYRAKIEERLESLCGPLTDKDRDRVLTEVAMFAIKADIDEEIKRLYSHISQFEENIELGKTVGRKLDFLCQEMNRETNTIGSKTQDLEISNLVLHSKSVIDKIKEQVQNVE